MLVDILQSTLRHVPEYNSTVTAVSACILSTKISLSNVNCWIFCSELRLSQGSNFISNLQGPHISYNPFYNTLINKIYDGT
jgi:hypothetical protein